MAKAKVEVEAETNYAHFKDEILMRCTSGACYNCMARSECTSLCKERGIDSSKDTPPCFEAWVLWGDMPYKKS